MDEQNRPYSETGGGKRQIGGATRVGFSLGPFFQRGGGMAPTMGISTRFTQVTSSFCNPCVTPPQKLGRRNPLTL